MWYTLKTMKKISLYLDTSIYNFAIADTLPREKEITQRLLADIKQGKYEAFISNVVTEEINEAPEEIAVRLRDIIKPLELTEIEIDEEVRQLADRYIEEGIIPLKYRDDALHIAAASVNNIDIIVSWNFEHIVKFKTKREVLAANTLLGYRGIEIYSPWEVVENV